ncbi:MAG: TraB/GumN family protein [Proteobacteria bacterium]|nr:TraB/GumN family protein [Pseudomonadota bacterium]
MSKSIAPLVAVLLLAAPPYSDAMPAQTGSAVHASKEAMPASPATSAPEAKSLDPIVVTVAKPYIWTFQKGNSKVLVLGTVYPEPEGLTFMPGGIRSALAQSGAVIGSPWFRFDAKVSLFSALSVWHEASGAKYLPDGKHLADVLSPADLQQWNELKAQYKPAGDVDRMRPMYAGWKLYEAVLRHSGVAVDSSIAGLIKAEADRRGIPMVDAMFHWTIKDPKTAARAFEPSPEADLACFESILHGIQGVPDASRTMAAAWAVGDVDTMKAYLGTHTLPRPCWATATQEAVAVQQGLDRDAEVRKAWLTAFDAAATKYPVVFTTASVQDIVHPARQVEWLMQEGYVEVP